MEDLTIFGKIGKSGNSHTIRIDPQIMNYYELTKGDYLVLNIQEVRKTTLTQPTQLAEKDKLVPHTKKPSNSPSQPHIHDIKE